MFRDELDNTMINGYLNVIDSNSGSIIDYFDCLLFCELLCEDDNSEYIILSKYDRSIIKKKHKYPSYQVLIYSTVSLEIHSIISFTKTKIYDDSFSNPIPISGYLIRDKESLVLLMAETSTIAQLTYFYILQYDIQNKDINIINLHESNHSLDFIVHSALMKAEGDLLLVDVENKKYTFKIQ